jgi:hypothetical protein
MLAGRNLIEEARLAEVHATTLCRFENGVYLNGDRPKTLAKISKFHGLPVSLLLSPATTANIAKAIRRRKAA